MNQKKSFHTQKVYRFRRFMNRAYGAFFSMSKVVNIGVLTGGILLFSQIQKTSAQTSLEIEPSHSIGEKELDEITITASRIEVTLEQSPKLITVITREEIQQSPAQSVQELLNSISGIDVLQRGGHGVQADISIRGGSFDQTAILLNGVNLSNPQTGHYSFDIPVNLNDIEHIEIIHGPSSLVYGASAFSGGINIITKKESNSSAYAGIQAGGHKLFGIEAGGALNSETTINQLSGSYTSSDGYIQNSDYDIFNMLLQTRLNFDNSKVDIQAGYNQKQYGANTFYSPQYANQYDKTKSYLLSVKSEIGNKLKFIPLVYWNRHDDCFQLFRDGTPNIPSWYTTHNYHRTDVYGTNLNLQYSSKIGVTSLSTEIRNENIISNVLGKERKNTDSKYTKSDHRTNISHVLEHNMLFNKFNISLGILANYNTFLKNPYQFYPNINASYRLTDSFRVYGSWNKATRMPTFTDLYYTTSTHIGNTNVRPERSESFEIGAKYKNSFINAYLSAYLMSGKDIIDWVKENEEDKWESKNFTQISKKGIDVGAKIHINKILPAFKNNTTIHLNYTHLIQDKTSENLISNYALNYLRDKLTIDLNYALSNSIVVSWNFRWQKRMGTYLKYEDLKPATVEAFPAFSTSNLKINWSIKNCTINMTANNVFDKKYYDLGNIPQAGFWLIGGFSYSFR